MPSGESIVLSKEEPSSEEKVARSMKLAPPSTL